MATAQELLKKYKQMKTLPHVVIHLSDMISNPSTSIQDFEEVIKLDPTLVIRLLRLVNSPYYGLRQKVTSISEAVVFIGMKNLRNLVVVAAIKEIFKERHNNDIFSRSKLWLHCAAVGICSQMISEHIFSKKGEDPFLCGILHDIGMIVEDQVAHDLFIQCCQAYSPQGGPFIGFEKEIIGTHHCDIGYALAREWKVPPEVQEGIKYHHNIKKIFNPSSITGIVQYSEFIVSKLNYPAMSKMTPQLSPHLTKYLSDNLDEFNALIQDLSMEIQKATAIYETQEDEL